MAEKLKALERENRELRQANEILHKASAYFARASNRASSHISQFEPAHPAGALGGDVIYALSSTYRSPVLEPAALAMPLDVVRIDGTGDHHA
jgi:hypothetical protein